MVLSIEGYISARDQKEAADLANCKNQCKKYIDAECNGPVKQDKPGEIPKLRMKQISKTRPSIPQAKIDAIAQDIAAKALEKRTPQPVSMPPSEDTIAEDLKALINTPRPSKSNSKYGLIENYMPLILEAHNGGVSYARINQVLKNNGVHIGTATLGIFIKKANGIKK